MKQNKRIKVKESENKGKHPLNRKVKSQLSRKVMQKPQNPILLIFLA